MFYFIDLNTFFDNTIHNIKKVDDRLDEYIKYPNEKNIHDIRTSIRRLDASFMVCPKKIQDKKLSNYVAQSKNLFKINSEIRDFDIILEKVDKEGQMDDLQFKSLEKSVKKTRKRVLEKAVSIANDMRKLDVPHLNIYNRGYDIEVIQKKLIKRYNKVVLKFETKIARNIPIVLTDSTKSEELHEARKDSKKLRYLFELLLKDKDEDKGNVDKVNENESNTYRNEKRMQEQIEKLKKIQDMLGNIHDYDITIAYLKDYGKRDVLSAVMNITRQRMHKYEEFVVHYKSQISNSENNLILPI
jgi:CHAD domain-containing protein